MPKAITFPCVSTYETQRNRISESPSVLNDQCYVPILCMPNHFLQYAVKRIAATGVSFTKGLSVCVTIFSNKFRNRRIHLGFR